MNSVKHLFHSFFTLLRANHQHGSSFKRLLLFFLVSTFSLVQLYGQTFDRKALLSYSGNTGINEHQQKVIYDDVNENYYHLSAHYGNSAAILTCIDDNGIVQWQREITMPNVLGSHFSSLCFNGAQDRIALVGTSTYVINDADLAIIEVDLTGSVTNSMVFDTDWGRAEGIAIRTFGDDYAVGGNFVDNCASSNCDRIFLATIETGTLTMLNHGVFSDGSDTGFESFMDMVVVGNEASVIAIREYQELMCLSFDLSTFTFLQNYGSGENVKGIFLDKPLETALHMAVDLEDEDLHLYVGSGSIVIATSELHAYHARLEYGSFNVNWSNEYLDSDPYTQEYSLGRIALHDATLASVYRQTGAPDNGVLRIDKNSGSLNSAIAYNDFRLGSLHDIQAANGSETFMTSIQHDFGLNNRIIRYFDGDIDGENSLGCDFYDIDFEFQPVGHLEKIYTYSYDLTFAGGPETATSTVVNGTDEDCTGGNTNSFKKGATVSLEDQTTEPGYAVYPNPTEGTIHITLSETINKVQITDIKGRIMDQITNPSVQFQYDLSSYPNGVYVIKLISNDEVSYLKLNKL